ncbi:MULTISPECIES: hypothetical protein [unclassified Flavobacterium]|uniref:hypothetical protein n=1 Tax=unclassified Flavobacterium TaxID=196869 RepID=UPI003F8F9D4D
MKKVKYLVICILVNLFLPKIHAQGDLYVTPSRVILDGAKQKAVLSVANTGKETATYSISFVQRRMNEDGSFTNIDIADEGAPFADPFLRIYPRQVTLAPNEGQSVILQLKRNQAMTDGEYRSHLYFRSEKNYVPLGQQLQDSVASVSVKLIPIFGISIPIIVRVGEVVSKASLSNIAIDFKEEQNSISFTIERQGSGSIYGDLKVEYIQPNGKVKEVGAINGVAVYTNIKKRVMKVPLTDSFLTKQFKGVIKVSYLDREDQTVIATSEITL